MKPQLKLLAALLLLSTINYPLLTAHAQGTAFTYQGQLYSSGSLANGSYDIKLRLYDAITNGNLIAGPVTNYATLVSNGIFTTVVDFGSVYDGTTLWLQLSVRTNGAANFTQLSPRQELTPAPYSIFAEGANAAGLTGTIPAGDLAGIYNSPITLNNPLDSFSGNGAGLVNVNASLLGGLASSNFWQSSGNAGTSAGINFVGTTDNQPLELHVKGQRAFRLEPDSTGSGSPNVIGGSIGNFMNAGGVIGGVIGGGGATNYNGVSYPNQVAAYYGSIVGGLGNTVQSFANGGSIGGGQNNTLLNGAADAVISGGISNSTAGSFSEIGGGSANSIGAGSDHSAIGGGGGNTVSGQYNMIGGGSMNTIANSSVQSFSGGGDNNTINSPFSVLGGGETNTIQVLADHSVIAGGANNTIVGGSASQAFAVIGGGQLNFVRTNMFYAAIAGGYGNTIGTGNSALTGSYNSIGGGGGNVIKAGASGSVIPGGVDNSILNANSYCFVGGGSQNTIQGTTPYSSVVGGENNTIQGSTFSSVIGGGFENTIQGSASESFIGGGGGNTVQNGSYDSFIGSGLGNLIQGNGSTAVIGGGANNTNSGEFSTIGGGLANTVTGTSSTILGGQWNLVTGNSSLAAGSFAQALHDQTFVWSDGTANFASTGGAQFLIHAIGGVGINLNNPTGDSLSIGGTARMNNNDIYLRASPDQNHGVGYYGSSKLWNNDFAPDGPIVYGYSGGALATIQNGIAGPNDGIALYWNSQNQVSAGGYFPVPGALFSVEDASCDGFNWNNASDRNLKEHLAPVNPEEVLAKVVSMPVMTWNYKKRPQENHLGPVAQDFHAAFGLNGTNDTSISTVDEGGVALAAIQGLNQKMEARSQNLEVSGQESVIRIQRLEAENADLKARLEKLEQFLLNHKSN